MAARTGRTRSRLPRAQGNHIFPLGKTAQKVAQPLPPQIHAGAAVGGILKLPTCWQIWRWPNGVMR